MGVIVDDLLQVAAMQVVPGSRFVLMRGSAQVSR